MSWSGTGRETGRRPCLPTRCGLCLFRFQYDDPVCAVTENGTRLDNFVCKHGAFVSNHPRKQFAHCQEKCSYKEAPGYHKDVISLHRGCARLTDLEPRDLYQTIRQYGCLQYSFEPLARETARRTRWLQLSLAEILHRGLLGHLPSEICAEVAQYLVCEYAAAQVTMGMWLGRSGLGCLKYGVTIIPSYIDYITHEGVKYVGALLRKPHKNSETRCLLPAEPTLALSILFVALDHAGIRDLLVSNGDKAPAVEECRGVWWKPVTLDRLGSGLAIDSDGIKLRDMFWQDTDEEVFLTNVPKLPTNFRLHRIKEYSKPVRLQSVCPDGGEIIGFSVFWSSGTLSFIHAHTEGESLAFYKERRDSYYSSWTYMAIAKGERLTEIWLQGNELGQSPLLLRTNKKRVAILGPYFERPSSSTLLDQNRKGLKPFFFDDTNGTIQTLAFESPGPSEGHVRDRPDMPTRQSKYPWFGGYRGPCFWTRADLNNIQSIALCRAFDGFTISGMLLRFPDDHQVSVGEIRRDRLGEWTSTRNTLGMWLDFSSEHTGGPQVMSVDLIDSASARRSGHDMEVRWHGRLEWWYTGDQCKIDWEGHESPPIENELFRGENVPH